LQKNAPARAEGKRRTYTTAETTTSTILQEDLRKEITEVSIVNLERERHKEKKKEHGEEERERSKVGMKTGGHALTRSKAFHLRNVRQ